VKRYTLLTLTILLNLICTTLPLPTFQPGISQQNQAPQPVQAIPLQPPPGYTPHPPIYIRNDTDLQQQAAAEGWPGDGTSTNPYLISGYAINASQAVEGEAAIHIENTTLYVCIQSCYLYGGRQNFKSGLHLKNATHVIVVNCTAADNSFGFWLYSSHNCTLLDCVAVNNWDGFCLGNSGTCTLSNCNATDNNGNGFWLYDSLSCVLFNCAAAGSWDGFWLWFSYNCTLYKCNANDSSNDGFCLEDSSACTLSNCSATNSYWYGFQLWRSDDCLLSNCTAADSFWDGFYLDDSSNCWLLNCSSTSNNDHGFELAYSSTCMLFNCTATSNSDGFRLLHSTNCTLSVCTSTTNRGNGFFLKYCDTCKLLNCTAATNDNYGFWLEESVFCVLEGCKARENLWNYYIKGQDVVDYTSHQIRDCWSVSKPVFYQVNETIASISSDTYGTIILANCTLSDTLSYIQLPQGGTIELAYSTSATIAHSNASGILLHYATNTLVTNTIARMGARGFELWHSSSCTLSNCAASDNKYGFALSYSNSCVLSGCIAVANKWYGLWLHYDSNCTLFNCTTSTTHYGNGIYIYGSEYCSVIGCWIENNRGAGIALIYCNNLTIYNNFFNNTINIHVYSCNDLCFNTTAYTPGPNIVGGPYLGGNYWSNYTGVDANGDGYGDTPYSITDAYAGAVFYDYLPLVPPPLAVMLKEPQQGQIYTYTRITIRWTYINTSAPIDHFELHIYNQSWDTGWIDVGTTTSYTIELAEGRYTVNITAYDTVGHNASDTASFIIDLSPPIVQILQPKNNTILNTTTVTIRWNGSDALSGIANYRICVYNETWDTNWINVGTVTNYTIELAPSTYTVAVCAIDRAGHNSTATITFTIQPPTEEQPPPEEQPPQPPPPEEEAEQPPPSEEQPPQPEEGVEQPPPAPSRTGLSTSILLAIGIVATAAAILILLTLRRRRRTA